MKVKAIRVSAGLITRLFTDGIGACSIERDALPEGAKLMWVLAEYERRVLWLIFEHESWEDVPNAVEIVGERNFHLLPALEPVFMSKPEIEDIRRMELGPGDVLVIQSANAISQETMRAIGANNPFPDNPILFLDQGMHVQAVLKKGSGGGE